MERGSDNIRSRELTLEGMGYGEVILVHLKGGYNVRLEGT